MHLKKTGLVLLSAAAMALAVLAGLGRPAGAVTQTFTATVRYANAAIVKKTSNIGLTPLPSVGLIFLFFDSYGNTWAQNNDAQDQARAITVANSSEQFINFLTSDMQSGTGLEAMQIVCLMHTSLDSKCSQLLAPGSGKNNTIYIGMNMLVKDHNRDKTGDGTMILADASPSIDITVVYQ
jgi:hypothetical protein